MTDHLARANRLLAALNLDPAHDMALVITEFEAIEKTATRGCAAYVEHRSKDLGARLACELEAGAGRGTR